MKREKRMNLILNLFFTGMVVIAFIWAAKIEKKSESDVKKQDFIILEKDSEISALYFDGRKMWVGTNTGVKVYAPDTLSVEKTVDDLKLVYSAGITGSLDGSIWIGHEKGLSQIRPEGERIDYQYPDIAKGRVNTVLYDGKRIWCGTYNGLTVLEPIEGRWQITQCLDSESGLCSDSVNTIIRVQKGVLIGSYLDTEKGGLTFIKDDGKIQIMRKEQGLPHPYITSMMELPSGEVLVGTGYMEDGGLALLSYKDGLYHVKQTLNKESGMPGEKIRSLYYGNQELFITTEYDGILWIGEEAFRDLDFEKGVYLKEENGLSDNEIKCIAESDKYYWLGGKYGLTLIEKE